MCVGGRGGGGGGLSDGSTQGFYVTCFGKHDAKGPSRIHRAMSDGV